MNWVAGVGHNSVAQRRFQFACEDRPDHRSNQSVVYKTHELTEARVKRIKAEAEAAFVAAELADVQTKAARAVELAAAGLVTQAELDGAQFAVRQAEAALKSARAAAQAPRQGSMRPRSTVAHHHSLADGRSCRQPQCRSGQTIAASLGSPVLFRIADLSTMLLLADVGEAEAGEVRPGDQVTFEVESIGVRTFTGTILEVRLGSKLEQAGELRQASRHRYLRDTGNNRNVWRNRHVGHVTATAATNHPRRRARQRPRRRQASCRRTSGCGSLLHGGHQRR